MPTRRRKHTDLFLLRIWCDEEAGDEGSGLRWRGRLQRPTSGEAHNFADWKALIAVLEAMLDERPQQVAEGSRRVPIEVPIDVQIRIPEKQKETNAMILVRIVFQAKLGKAGELAGMMKESLDQMKRGGQRGRLLTDLSGPLDTVVLEIEYASLAVAEQVRAHMFTMPEFQEGQRRTEGLILSGHQELYTIEAES